MKTSSDVIWQYNAESVEDDSADGYEYFTVGMGEGIQQYHVDRAKALIEATPREIIRVAVSEVVIYAYDGTDLIDDPEIDLDVPIILISLSDGSRMPIDGLHRISKAKALQIGVLPAVVLDLSETAAIRF